MSATHAPDGYRVRGWHVLGGVTAFFAVVIGVDVTFMALALKTYPGEVSVTPYEDGLLYNRRIAQLEAQAALGWRAAAEAQPGVVVVQVQDRTGAPVAGLSVSGRLERPATEAGRRMLTFQRTAPGRYEATTGAIDGAWDLTAEARDGQGRLFTAERRLTWR
ncbi:FixH family protein [Phenylobacterium sp. J367]|uniref:FixH family protein n=1 Tax=Phenylobacterium sp. J367 TaxID=2898435 RepID=UPI002151CC42|nr:FixH family protein [Phenylobacterium sp. J367]MCR5881050.1 FixH family protein [Phenylobacterium sp. J367]